MTEVKTLGKRAVFIVTVWQSFEIEYRNMGADSAASHLNSHGISKTLEKKIQRKQKRFQHMIRNETGIECYDEPKKVQPTLVHQNEWSLDSYLRVQ